MRALIMQYLCVCTSIGVSVHPSLSYKRYCIKMAEHRIMQAMLYDNPGTVVF